MNHNMVSIQVVNCTWFLSLFFISMVPFFLKKKILEFLHLDLMPLEVYLRSKIL